MNKPVEGMILDTKERYKGGFLSGFSTPTSTIPNCPPSTPSPTYPKNFFGQSRNPFPLR